MTNPQPPKPSADPVITDADLYQAFRLMKAKDYDGALKHITEGLKKAEEKKDTGLQGLYHSALGVLHKLKKDYKKSYKCYQQAEKLLPDESSLKIISALLLIEEFNQFDTALKKLDKVLQAEAHDPAMVHHARAVQGLAYLGMGKKDKAKECLEGLIAGDFNLLRSATNLDFKLAEALLRKGVAVDRCKAYLEKALVFVQGKREKVYEKVIRQLLVDLPSVVK